MPGSRDVAWPIHSAASGPPPTGMFMQSNFGIVTKMGVWLMPAAGVLHAPLASRLEGRAISGPAIETLRALMLDGTIENVPQLVNTHRPGLGASRAASQWYEGEGPIPDPSDSTRSRASLEHRPLDHALRALRRRARSSSSGSGKIKEAFAGSPAREVSGDEVRCRSRSRTSSIRPSASRAACRASTQPDDALVRRRGGRPHRLLTGRAAHRPGRDRLRQRCSAG